MANKFWLGTADAVAQVDTVQITAYDATTTYKITIGGVVVSVIGNTDADTTASDLQVALEASTHPYFANITFTVATDTVTLTAGTAGVPHTATSSVTGGAGTIGSVTNTTASAGPCDWSTAENWSDGAIPASTDSVSFADSAVNACYGLSNAAVLLVDLFIEQTYTGKIGLDRTSFATSADGETVDTSKQEYREDYLKINADVVEIGKKVGVGTSAGSGRIKLDNAAAVAGNTITIFNTANIGAESNLPPVRLMGNSANLDIYIRSGRVGIGVDAPHEAPTIGDLYLNGANSNLYVGAGVELTSMVQSNGKSLIQAITTIVSIKLLDGFMTLEGDYTVTTLTIEGGVCYPNHVKTSGAAITTFEINGGTVIANQTSRSRTWTTVAMKRGASLTVDPNQVALTNGISDPADEYTVTMS